MVTSGEASISVHYLGLHLFTFVEWQLQRSFLTRALCNTTGLFNSDLYQSYNHQEMDIATADVPVLDNRIATGNTRGKVLLEVGYCSTLGRIYCCYEIWTIQSRN